MERAEDLGEYECWGMSQTHVFEKCRWTDPDFNAEELLLTLGLCRLH